MKTRAKAEGGEMSRLEEIASDALKVKAAAMLGVKLSWVASVVEDRDGAFVRLKHGACLGKRIPLEYWV
jgi:hypothetical protein